MEGYAGCTTVVLHENIGESAVLCPQWSKADLAACLLKHLPEFSRFFV